MYTTLFELAVALLENYLKQNYSLSKDSSSSHHCTWRSESLSVVATSVSASSVIVNLVSGKETKTVQLTEEDVAVELPADTLSPAAHASFARWFDAKVEPPQKTRNHNTKEPPAPFGVSGIEKSEPFPGARAGLVADSRRPADMPGFDDEYELQAKPQRLRTSAPSIGNQDLHPAGIGANPLLRPFHDPLAAPGGGGMYPTSDHPIFGQQKRNTSRAGVPPGARFDDPYGEDNLDDMGMGLPGNLRGPGGPGGFGGFGPGSGSGFNSGNFGF